MKIEKEKRRDFLKKTLSIAALLPFLPSAAKAAGSDIKRLVLIQHPDGINPIHWYPSGSQKSFTLPSMTSPFEKVKKECVFLSGINLEQTAGHGAYQALWRGDKSRESIDQYFAEKWRGNTPISILVQKTNGGYGGRDLSYDARGRSIPSTLNTATLFNKVYTNQSIKADLSASVARQRERLASTREELDTLMQGGFLNDDILATHDKALNDVLNSLSSIDPSASVINMESWKNEFESRASTGNPFDDVAYKHEDIIVNALKYDRCRVFNYSYGADVWDYNMLCDNGKSYPYHNSGHAMNEGHIQTRKQTSKHVADFIQRLRDTNDIYGNPILDSTLVVYGCEIGHAANHSSRNAPFILAGAGLEGGRYLSYSGVNWNKLLVSISQILGDSVSRYGSYGNYTDGGLEGLI